MSPVSTKPQILAALPGSAVSIAARTKLVESTVRRHLRALRDEGKAHIQKRKRTSGKSASVWAAGPGPEAPPIGSLTNADWSKRYRKRVRKAIQKAEAGGKVDDRYSRHVALHKASKTVQQARREPQNPFSALFAVAGQGRGHGAHQDN